jgi:hypothetical protein
VEKRKSLLVRKCNEIEAGKRERMMVADIERSSSVSQIADQDEIDDGRKFATFRLACYVKRLWAVHVHEGKYSYPDFFRTREAYSQTAMHLQRLSGRAVHMGEMTKQE